MTEPEGDDESSEITPERQAWYDELFRLKDKLILLALREAEYFFEKDRGSDDYRTVSDAVSEEFDNACREYVLHQLKGIGIT